MTGRAYEGRCEVVWSPLSDVQSVEPKGIRKVTAAKGSLQR